MTMKRAMKMKMRTQTIKTKYFNFVSKKQALNKTEKDFIKIRNIN